MQVASVKEAISGLCGQRIHPQSHHRYRHRKHDEWHEHILDLSGQWHPDNPRL